MQDVQSSQRDDPEASEQSATGGPGRIVPEADGRVVCSLRPWPSPITTGTAIR